VGSFGATAARTAASTTITQAGIQRRELLLVWTAGFAGVLLLTSVMIDATPANGLVFNEMLSRLLQGRFDLSPATIGDEAIVHGGRTYAYFGVFCALLRLPLLLTGQMGLDVTKASIVAAAGLSLAARLMAVSVALGRAESMSRPLRLAILAAVAFGGESLEFLKPSIFQEVCSWGAALASVFVLLAVRRALGADRGPALGYAGMAAVAGLALLCRVSFGLGLYAALGLMLCVEAWRSRARPLALKPLAPAVLVLALFAGAALGVNAARWERPLTFVPFREQLALVRHGDDRLQRVDRYGELNLRRVPFALQYYLAPVWVLGDGKGGLLLQKAQLQLFDDVELPPSSPFLTDPVICLLAGIGVFALARRRLPRGPLAYAALAGLACPILVLLTAISLCFRYRMDFYPALDFAACLGAASLQPGRMIRPSLRLGLLAGLGAATAVVTLWLSCFAPFGPALDLDIRRGWAGPIQDMASGRNPYLGHLRPDGTRVNVPPARR
jgi:hypothetical protein